MAVGDVTTIRDMENGWENVLVGTVEGPSTYATGGFALAALDGGAAGSAIDFALTTVDFVAFELVEVDADEAFVARWDRATSKIQVYECLTADALQEIGAVDISSLDIRFRAHGRK